MPVVLSYLVCGHLLRQPQKSATFPFCFFLFSFSFLIPFVGQGSSPCSRREGRQAWGEAGAAGVQRGAVELEVS